MCDAPLQRSYRYCRSCNQRRQTCPTCGGSKSATKNMCRACYLDLASRPVTSPREKRCTKCSEVKPIELFNRDGRSKTGYGSWCKACHVAKNRQWQRDNPDKVRARNERWEKKNPEYMRRKWHRQWLKKKAGGYSSTPKVRAWRERNREHVRDYANTRYHTEPERAKRWAMTWQRKNAERVAVIRRATHLVQAALKRGALVKGTKCEFCGASGAPLEAAHWDYSRPLDVKWLCRPCHRKWDHEFPKSKSAVGQRADRR